MMNIYRHKQSMLDIVYASGTLPGLWGSFPEKLFLAYERLIGKEYV